MTGLDALASLAPRAARSITSDRALTFTTTMRVIAGVHGRTTDRRAGSLPAGFTSFAEVDEVPVFVTNDTDGSAAVLEELADFARSQANDDIFAFVAKDLSRGSGGTAHLSAFARLKLEAMDEGSFRNVLKFEAVADFDVGLFARDDHIANLEVLRLKDVGLYAIRIADERDVGVAVGIVFNRLDGRGDVVLAATEVDDTITTLVATADVTAGDFTLIVAATGLFDATEQRFFRSGFGDVLKRGVRHGTTRLGIRTIRSNSHSWFSYIGCFSYISLFIYKRVIPYSLKRSTALPSATVTMAFL